MRCIGRQIGIYVLCVRYWLLVSLRGYYSEHGVVKRVGDIGFFLLKHNVKVVD